MSPVKVGIVWIRAGDIRIGKDGILYHHDTLCPFVFVSMEVGHRARVLDMGAYLACSCDNFLLLLLLLQ